jgi:hypothetical protein
MKRLSLGMFIAAIFVAVILFSCKKEKVPNLAAGLPFPKESSLSSLSSFFASNGAKSQLFVIDNTQSQKVFGAQGTILTFDAHSFVTLSGSAVNGMIEIELKEIYDKKTMLLSNITTMGETYPGGPQESLISGGEFYVNAKQNNEPLKLATGQKYKAFLPSAGNPYSNMYYFNGKNAGEDILWASSVSLSDSIPVSIGGMYNGYFMDCDSLKWVNCDMFSKAPTHTTVSLKFSTLFDPSLIRIFFWYDNDKAVVSFGAYYDQATQKYTNSKIPSYIQAHFIAVCVVNGKLYTAITGGYISDNSSFDLDLKESTEKDFSDALSALP